MLGLLGTVVGMVGAFNTISSAEGFARPDQLAGDISQALVTTLMGLGLAIVYRIVKDHGGRVVIDPERVRGTCIEIRIPRPRADEVSASAMDEPTEVSS